jgi:methylated-DNA-[protein]-cysteine S-methyltransferase
LENNIMLTFHLNRIESPIGKLLLVTDPEHHVRALEFADHEVRMGRLLREHYGQYELVEGVPNPFEREYIEKLDKYFRGDLTAVADIPVQTQGTEFQEQVWAALKHIPAGEVTTYGELARDLGYSDPRMAKEIGAAVGANPAAVIVACHRVIGANGDLKGYAGGPHRKEWLLGHEKAVIPAPQKRSKTLRRAAVDSTASLPGF